MAAYKAAPPKPVLKFLEGRDGSDITLSEIDGLDPPQRKSLQNAFYEFMKKKDPDLMSQYSGCATREERKHCLLNFLIDTSATTKRVGTNTSSVNSEERDVWVTESMLRGPNFLNNPEHAAIVVKDGRRSRDYEGSKALADAGVKEYVQSG